jgi:hypothetical protein
MAKGVLLLLRAVATGRCCCSMATRGSEAGLRWNGSTRLANLFCIGSLCVVVPAWAVSRPGGVQELLALQGLIDPGIDRWHGSLQADAGLFPSWAGILLYFNTWSKQSRGGLAGSWCDSIGQSGSEFAMQLELFAFCRAAKLTCWSRFVRIALSEVFAI